MCIGILLFLFLSPFSLTSRNLVVESDPVGADVYIQGTRAGKTPLTFPLDQKTLKQSEGIRVSITYPGYTPFDTKLSPDTATDCWYVCAGLLPIGTPGPVSSKGVRQISLSTNFTQGALNGYSIPPGQTMAFHTKIKTGRVQATALLYQTNLVFIVDNMDKNIELDFPTRPVIFILPDSDSSISIQNKTIRKITSRRSIAYVPTSTKDLDFSWHTRRGLSNVLEKEYTIRLEKGNEPHTVDINALKSYMYSGLGLGYGLGFYVNLHPENSGSITFSALGIFLEKPLEENTGLWGSFTINSYNNNTSALEEGTLFIFDIGLYHGIRLYNDNFLKLRAGLGILAKATIDQDDSSFPDGATPRPNRDSTVFEFGIGWWYRSFGFHAGRSGSVLFELWTVIPKEMYGGALAPMCGLRLIFGF